MITKVVVMNQTLKNRKYIGYKNMKYMERIKKVIIFFIV